MTPSVTGVAVVQALCVMLFHPSTIATRLTEAPGGGYNKNNNSSDNNNNNSVRVRMCVYDP